MPSGKTSTDPTDHPVGLITGASRGIGAAAARELARAGYKLVLAARSVNDLDNLARELEAMGCICRAVRTDVRKKEDLAQLARTTLDLFGHVDVLLHNAGVVHPGVRISDLTDDIVADLIATNLIAPIELTRQLLPSMLERQRGFICFVDSVGGHIAIPTAAMYSSTKFALRGFAGSLRREVMADGIKVSIISPGFISTRLTDEIQHIIDGLWLPMGAPEQVARVIMRAITKPRREIIFPAYYRVFTWFERNFPSVLDLVSSVYLSRILPEVKNVGGRDDKRAEDRLE